MIFCQDRPNRTVTVDLEFRMSITIGEGVGPETLLRVITCLYYFFILTFLENIKKKAYLI